MQKTQIYDHCFKIFILGSPGVGKSNLLSRYAEDSFSNSYKPTIGIDFHWKMVHSFNQTVKLHLWDTAGEPRFNEIIKECLNKAQGALICFDLTNQNSFNQVNELIHLVKENTHEEKAPIILIGCKSDLVAQRTVDSNAAQKLATSLGINYIEVSAYENKQIDEVFTTLVKQLLWQPTLNKISTMLTQYYENYLKVCSRYNTPGLFTIRPTAEEVLLQNEYASILLKLLHATNIIEVSECYGATLALIDAANILHAKENPYLSKLLTSHLSNMLKQSLTYIKNCLPDIDEFVTSTSIEQITNSCSSTS